MCRGKDLGAGDVRPTAMSSLKVVRLPLGKVSDTHGLALGTRLNNVRGR